MNDMLTGLSNALSIILVFIAMFIAMAIGLKVMKRNTQSGDYIARAKANKSNNSNIGIGILVIMTIGLFVFFLSNGMTRIVCCAIILILLLIALMFLFKSNTTDEHDEDIRKYTKYKQQINEQTAGTKGMVAGAALAGTAAGIAVASTGVGAPVGAAMIASSVSAGAAAGKEIGKATKGVHARRAANITDVSEDFSATINETQLEDGVQQSINIASNLQPGFDVHYGITPKIAEQHNIDYDNIEACKQLSEQLVIEN